MVRAQARFTRLGLGENRTCRYADSLEVFIQHR